MVQRRLFWPWISETAFSRKWRGHVSTNLGHVVSRDPYIRGVDKFGGLVDSAVVVQLELENVLIAGELRGVHAST